MPGRAHKTHTNQVTIDVTTKACKDGGRDRTRRNFWSKVDGDAFFALLGTPDGSGVSCLVADYFDDIGGKTVRGIATAMTDESFDMIIELSTGKRSAQSMVFTLKVINRLRNHKL